MSYFIPSGQFERTTKNLGSHTQTVVVPNSYEEIPKHYSLRSTILGETVEGAATPVSLLGILSAIPKGLADSAALVFYVFIIGAVFTVIRQTGAISAFLFFLIDKFKTRPKLLLFLIYMTVFSGSSFMGLAPETIALIPVFLYLSKHLGYDRLFGFALLSVPIYLGWSTGVTNPFTVQIAQTIAELPIGSGIGLRFLMYIVYAALGFAFIVRYGERVKRSQSQKEDDDSFSLEEYGSFDKTALEKKHISILIFFTMSFSAVLVAVQTIGWGLIEMSACFIAILIVVSKIAGMTGDQSMEAFTEGLKVMIVPALVVGVARGISVVLQEGMIIDTILHHSSRALLGMPKIAAAEGMLVFQTGLNFFIPSASGQALVSMPLMTPMSDIIGLSRQTAVMAYLLGDGLSNLIIPTNGVLMAMLGFAKVSFQSWFKLVLSLFLISMVIAFVFLALAVSIGY